MDLRKSSATITDKDTEKDTEQDTRKEFKKDIELEQLADQLMNAHEVIVEYEKVVERLRGRIHEIIKICDPNRDSN